jgi:hypothetical protein
MNQDSYAKLFWADMQKYNNSRMQTQVEEEIIALLQSHVTCPAWYTCEKCKGFKMAIATIKNKEKSNVEGHTTTSSE